MIQKAVVILVLRPDPYDRHEKSWNVTRPLELYALRIGFKRAC
jgi:hypothetical protein